MFIFLLMMSACSGPEQEIRESVDQKLSQYPASTLKDLYKSYFQDYFGPGHLIADTAAARRYLMYELEHAKQFDTLLLEPTGYRHNFYRVNLVLIREGVIPLDTFMHYFIESVNSVESITLDAWKKEWGAILEVIRESRPGLEHFARDEQLIDSLLKEGEYVVHHSKEYLDRYHPHYRLVHREIFDEHLSGYLD